MAEMWTPPRRAASHDISAISETSAGPPGYITLQISNTEAGMKHVDPMTLAEIGAWQDFPPQSSIRRALGRIAGHCGVWIARSRQRRALAELDDRLLRDIGITRYDAAHEAKKPFWR